MEHSKKMPEILPVHNPEVNPIAPETPSPVHVPEQAPPEEPRPVKQPVERPAKKEE